MKYSETNKPIQCMMKNSTCYKNSRTMEIKGILIHSTGCNNTNIKRYVQPCDNDKNYAQLIKLIGKNASKNDWNHIYKEAGLNAWIGKLADGTVATVQTMPWDMRPWGCGSGSKGSCNNGWVQFEICEDTLADKAYFTKCYNEMIELLAYLCKKYNLNPKGSATMNGIKVPVILGHSDSHRLGLGSNHGDPWHWFNKYGKTLAVVQQDVYNKLHGTVEPKKEEPKKTEPKKETPNVIKDWQKAAIADGYKFPKYGADGKWGTESEAVAKKAVLKKVLVFNKNKNLVKIVQAKVGVAADGKFGAGTKEAVIKFQKKNGLTADGVVGLATWKKILGVK